MHLHNVDCCGWATAWLSVSVCVIVASADHDCCLLSDRPFPLFSYVSLIIYSLRLSSPLPIVSISRCLSIWGALWRYLVHCTAWICLQSWLHHQLQCSYITPPYYFMLELQNGLQGSHIIHSNIAVAVLSASGKVKWLCSGWRSATLRSQLHFGRMTDCVNDKLESAI